MGILIRKVRPTDDEALARFYGELSAESLHARFLGSMSGINARVARSFCTLDHMHDEGLVAVLDDPARRKIVGHVCLLDTGTGAVEIGICVADRYQGLGIGRRLFERAVAWARDHGYQSVTASCYTDNSRVLSLLSSAPHGAQTTLAGAGTVNVTIPLVGELPTTTDTWPKGAWASFVSRGRSHGRERQHRGQLHMFRLPRRRLGAVGIRARSEGRQ